MSHKLKRGSSHENDVETSGNNKDKKSDKKNKKEKEKSDKENGSKEQNNKNDKNDKDHNKSEKKEKNENKKLIKQVNNFVVEEPFVAPLFLKFVRSNQAEELAHELVNMFYAKHKHTECIVEDAIFYVAQEYPNGNELLRSTNIFVAVLSECARLGGHRYLSRVLGQHVKQIAGQLNDGETDSLQLWTNDHSKNTGVIVQFATTIMDKIMASATMLPMFLKQMMIALHKSMSRNKANPVSGSMLISAFLFLRFICPALVSPHCYGLLKDPPPITAQRMLVSIAKMLQAVVNSKIDLAKQQEAARLLAEQQHQLKQQQIREKKMKQKQEQQLQQQQNQEDSNTSNRNSNSDNSNTQADTNSKSTTSTTTPNSSEADQTETAPASTPTPTSTPSPHNSSSSSNSSADNVSNNTATPESEHDIAVGEFIKKYSPQVEVYAIAVLDKKGECDGKRFYKVAQQKEYGRLALQWMQDNKEQLIEYLMKNKQIRDKLAFEQFLSKASHGELNSNHRSPRLFSKGPMGLGRRKKEAEPTDDDYEKVRLHHKRELRKTKRKEEEKQLARKKEKEGEKEGASPKKEANNLQSRSPAQAIRAGHKVNSSPDLINKPGIGGNDLDGAKHPAPHAVGQGTISGGSVGAVLTKVRGNQPGQQGAAAQIVMGPGGVPLERGRSDSWVFLTDDDTEDDERDALLSSAGETELPPRDGAPMRRRASLAEGGSQRSGNNSNSNSQGSPLATSSSSHHLSSSDEKKGKEKEKEIDDAPSSSAASHRRSTPTASSS